MAEVQAERALIVFPAEVVVRRRTCAVDDARFVVVVVGVGSAAVRSVAPLVEHLLKPNTALTPDQSNFQTEIKMLHHVSRQQNCPTLSKTVKSFPFSGGFMTITQKKPATMTKFEETSGSTHSSSHSCKNIDVRI